jgi:hypothetical protein
MWCFRSWPAWPQSQVENLPHTSVSMRRAGNMVDRRSGVKYRTDATEGNLTFVLQPEEE